MTRRAFVFQAVALCLFAFPSPWALGADPAGVAEGPGNGATSTPASSAQFFDANIAPLLAKRCLECHDSATKKGRLDLSRKEAALAGDKKGQVIVPGKADQSRLWKAVESDEMPEDRPPLSAEEKKLLRQWIDAGAVWSSDAIDPLAYTRDGRAAFNWVRRLTVPEYVETVRSAVGVDIEADARRLLPADVRADGFNNTAYNLTADLAHVEAYSALAETIAGRMDVAAFAAQFSARTDLGDESLRALVATMGKWLLRGPLEDHEVAAFLGVARAVRAEGGDFAEAARYVVEAMLQSPRFVYRIEAQRGDGAAKLIASHELASRLSYFVWGGPPDKELMRAADAGELAHRDRLDSQTRRMLRDPRAVRRSLQFIDEWLHLDRLHNLRPSKARFPEWDERLAADMREETVAYFRHVVWEKKRPLSELLNSRVTFATPRLARHYGLAVGGTAAGLVRVAGGPERVKGGLQALYTFERSSGDTVRDVSGAGDPLDLKIADSSAVRWTDGGLAVTSPTLIATPSPTKKLTDALKKANALTLEAWVTPADAAQTGPARILTLSADPSGRNFTLGQDGAKFDVRLRTTKTDGNGQPSLAAGGPAAKQPTHVVYTRDPAGKARLFIDGEQKADRDTGGDLSNWEGSFRLALANELTKDRPWRGTMHLVALYDRALSGDEVRQNQAAGARPQPPRPVATTASPAKTRDNHLLALYRFDERSGDAVRDSSGAGEPLHLRIEDASAVTWYTGGLTVSDSALVSTAAPPERLIDAARKSNALTVEAWLTPAQTAQAGPARILTLSSGTSQRNFTLGQDGDKFDVRFRSTKTDPNGQPSLASPAGSVKIRPTHVAYTFEPSGKARLFVDGEEKASRDLGGDLSNWEGGFRLALANETTKDRPWRGTFHRVAIYSRALAPDEIRAAAVALRIPRPTDPGEEQYARGDAPTRYDLSSVPGRGGLLTQGSVLTIGGDDASMVTRGLFVLHDFLYSAVGNPPPCADTTPVPTRPGQSQRVIAEGRIANSSCGGCHVKFEPLAFALERFDGLGAYHEADEHGNKLRADGQVQLPDAREPSAYGSTTELMDLLASSERVRMNMTRKVTQFALGRPLVEADAAELEKIHQASQAGGGTYESLVAAIVTSDLVRMTRTEANR